MGLFGDPREVGRRISAARGYAQMPKTEFARKLDTSVPTLRRMENGEVGSVGTTAARRREMLERVMRVAKCPAEIVGLEAPPESRLQEIERELTELRDRLDRQIPVEEIGRRGSSGFSAAEESAAALGHREGDAAHEGPDRSSRRSA